MRITLTIDDGVLTAARALAAREHETVGGVISALAHKALQTADSGSATRNDVPLLAVRTSALPLTPELVNQLRDECLDDLFVRR